MRVIGVTAVLLAVSAAGAAAITAPMPTPGTFSGVITSGGGRYAGDHGHVVVRDADLVSHASGRLVISGAPCRGARHCLALTGRPVGSLKLTGHPIPDAGYTFSVSGSGRVSPLGRVKVSGRLQVPGFVACGHETMTLTLSGRRGWVKVATATPLRCAAARRADRVAGG
jgi:hypothetical protein